MPLSLNFLIVTSFRVINLNNVGDQAVEKERDAWIEVSFNLFILNKEII